MIEQIGAMDLDLQYVKGQSFKEYFLLNQDRFNELFTAETRDTIQLVRAC